MKKILQLIIAVSLMLVVVDRPGINACELKIVELAETETTVQAAIESNKDLNEVSGRYPFADRLLIK